MSRLTKEKCDGLLSLPMKGKITSLNASVAAGIFMYEVVREKMIIGTSVLTDADIRIFFKDKQAQDENVAIWTDQTLVRLGKSYKTHLFEAGLLDDNMRAEERKILKPILDPVFKHWLEDYGYGQVAKAMEGIR